MDYRPSPYYNTNAQTWCLMTRADTIEYFRKWWKKVGRQQSTTSRYSIMLRLWKSRWEIVTLIIVNEKLLIKLPERGKILSLNK